MLYITTISNPTATGSTATNAVSWINQNGMLIAKSGILPGVLGATPPFGVIPHELGHGLALTHSDYGAGGASNLMTAGTSRTEASTSGCSPPGITSGGQPNTNGGLLYDLAYAPAVPVTCVPAMTAVADDLTLSGGVPCTSIDPASCSTQQGAVLLSGFVNLSLAATATAGGGGGSATAATANSTIGSGNPNGPIPFRVDTFGGGGESGATIGSVIFALAPGLDFQGNTPATQTGGSPGLFIINQVRLNGNEGFGNQNCMKSAQLASAGRHCVQLFFTVGAFTVDKFITFTLKIANQSGPLTLSQINQLAGTNFTVLSDNGNGVGSTYATTTTFETVGGFLQPADSRFPDLSITNQLDASTFVGATQTSCSPFTLSPSDCKMGELPQGQD
jgi:hypothetical protein